MSAKIDYDGHPELKREITRFISDSLQALLQEDYAEDMVELVQYYSSATCPSTVDEIEKELRDEIFQVRSSEQPRPRQKAL